MIAGSRIGVIELMRPIATRAQIAIVLGFITAIALSGCSGEKEPVELDPGVSPFYPGPAKSTSGATAAGPAQTQPAASTGGPQSVAASGKEERLDTTFGANAVERQLRLAQRTARDGDRAKAGEMLDRILATEPVNREALYQRAVLALEAFHTERDVPERRAAIARAGELARTILRAHEVLKGNEVDIIGRILYAEVEARVLEGRIDLALAALKKANDLGFNAVQRVETDKNMAALRASPQYKATIKAIEDATLAQAQERVRSALANPPKFAFDFTLADPDGKKVALADFKGKVVLVDFWGTWCNPCRKSLPHLIGLYKRYHGHGLEIVGLNYETEAADEAEARSLVRQVVQQAGIPYPCLMGDEKTKDRVPGFGAFPTSLLLDRSGKVRMLAVGYGEKTIQQIADAITVLLSEQSPPAAAPNTKK